MRQHPKFGNPKQVCDVYEQGRQDAMNGRPMNIDLKKHRNKTVAKAYCNGYREGQEK